MQNVLEYLAKGWSVIPVGDDKKPLIRWEEYQKRLPTKEEIETWWSSWPDANIGIVTGEISNLVVVDIEKGGECEGTTPTVISRTGGGGFHYYYQHPGGVIKNSVKALADKVDIRGDGGFVVAPPSLHKSGNNYRWEVGPDEAEVQPLPEDLLNRIKKPNKKSEYSKKNIPNQINHEGERNDTAAKVVGKLLHSMDEDKWEELAWPRFQLWNQEKNRPPLDERELRSVFDSISQRAVESKESKKEDEKQSHLIINYIIENCELFIYNGEPYAVIPVKNHKENHPISSATFKGWLCLTAWRKILGKIPASNSITEASACLDGLIREQNNKKDLSNRTARDSHDNYWLDMTDDKWRAIKLNKEGWSIVDEPPTLFRRYAEHQISMVEPNREGGDIKLIEKYLNIHDKEYVILIYAVLITSILEGISVPCLAVHGPQGSSKTTIFRLLRSIVDPSCLGVIDFNDAKQQIIQTLDHNKINFFDNLSGIKRSISDLLAKVITGSGFTQRKLYQNDEDYVRRMKRVIGLNGINMVATMPDLLERSVVIETALIDEKDRKTDSDIDDSFNHDLPNIVGGLLNLAVDTLNYLSRVEKNNLPRMADYALHGEAMAISMGYEAGYFLSVYNRNIAETNRVGIEANQVADVLLTFIRQYPGSVWSGTVKDLLSNITELEYETTSISEVRNKYWPKNASEMGRKLREIEPILRKEGLLISYERNSFQRSVTIKKTKEMMTDDGNDSELDTENSEPVAEQTRIEGIEF